MRTDLATPGSSNIVYWDMWAPGHLIDSAVLTSGSDEKILVNSMRQLLVIHNQSVATAHVKVIRLKCRRTYDSSTAAGPLALMNVSSGYTVQTLPFSDPTTSSTFRRYYKILSVRSRTLSGGKSMTLKRKIYSNSGRVIRGDVEGLATNWAYSGMYTTMIHFSSMPMVEKGESETDYNLTGIAGIQLSSVNSLKIVYRLIEDNDPDTNSRTNTFANVNQGIQFNAGTPLVTTYATQAADPLPPVYVVPSPIVT